MNSIGTAIIMLIIMINMPAIIGTVIGFVWGLVEMAAEGGNKEAEDCLNDNNDGANLSGLPEPVFFSGCKTPEDYKDRYRALMKIYHPDGEHGDVEVTKQINRECMPLSAFIV